MVRDPSHRRAKPGGAEVPAFFLYGEPLRAPDERTVHVETIAARSRLHDWKIQPHRHRDLQQVLMIWRGLVDARIDDRRESLRGPAVVTVPPGTVHSFRFAKDTEGLVVTFAPGLAREIFRASRGLGELLDAPAATQVHPRRLRATDAKALGTILLREFSRSALGRESALHAILGALLTQVLRLTRGNAPAPASANRGRELVGRFRESIERNYRQHWEVGAYAAGLGCSEAALRKACLAVAAQSPVELVHARLLIEAERQLRYTGLSVTQIAYHLGFEDPAYFSRFFTKRAGGSPRSFRAGSAG
jgi:AraC family transcriptional regulator, transcriptional activator of pobA